MKYRIIRVTNGKEFYYKIQHKWFFMWVDEIGIYNTFQEAEEEIYKEREEEIVRNY